MTWQRTRLFLTWLEIIVALCLGRVIVAMGNSSVAWIFGGMGAGIIVVRSYSAFTHKSIKPQKIVRKMGQAMVGLAIGLAIGKSNLSGAGERLPLLVFLTIFMLSCGIGIGYIYAGLSRTNLLNALLATVPGGVSTMSSLAAEYNGNVAEVAMLQTLRLTSVIVIIPLIAGTSWLGTSNTTFFVQDYFIDSNPPYLGLFFLAIILGWWGIKIVNLLPLGASSFFGTLMGGLVFSCVLTYVPFFHSLEFTPPLSMSLMGQILLGITVGEAWSVGLERNTNQMILAVGAVLMTLLSGFLAATIATNISSLDWLTCLLVTAPGGSTEMIVIATAYNRHPEIVTLAHSVRLLALNLSLPILMGLFAREKKPNILKK